MHSPTESSVWRPYTQEKIARPSIKVSHAKGSYLYESSGRKIFDGIASWWVITHGHCHPAISDAIARQASRMDQVNFANFTHDLAEELAEKILRIAPQGLKKVFFSDNGSTAIEVALKMALQAQKQRGYVNKKDFIAFASAYHGDTVGAMSVSASGTFTAPYREMMFHVHRAPQPTHSTASVEEFVSGFRSIIEEHHQSVAGVIIEPLIQGAGGMIIWPVQALREISALCRRYGAYLIFDEVMTGFGRTGSVFAADQICLSPDLLCLSKGLTAGALPLSLTLASGEIYEAFLSDQKAKMLFHGHSFTGNPIACAAAIANLQVFQDDDVPGRLRQIEEIQRSRLGKLSRKMKLVDPRVCGTIAAFEVDSSSAHSTARSGERGYASHFSEALTQAAMKKDLFIRPLGQIVYLLPPYSANATELNEAWDALESALDEVIR